jgi:hypothetical protein
VLQGEVFVGELSTVDGFAASSVVVCEIYKEIIGRQIDRYNYWWE